MENIMLLIVGLLICVLGIVNISGNISTIHSYNRKNVSEEDTPKYGRAVGLGTLIIGISIIISFVLTVAGLAAFVPFVIVPSLIAGLVLILYAQFKYNKGIF